MVNLCSPERTPRYRLHKRTGQAVVTIDGKDIYLGKHHSAASREAYRRKVAEWSGSPNVRSFMGYPVYLTSQMPIATAVATKCALFGAFDQAVILADRGGVSVARSDDYKFLDDKITLRGTSRYDIRVHDTGTSAAAGAYVALSTHS